MGIHSFGVDDRCGCILLSLCEECVLNCSIRGEFGIMQVLLPPIPDCKRASASSLPGWSMADFSSGSNLDTREGNFKIDVLENMWCLFLVA